MEISAKGTIRKVETNRWNCSISQSIVKCGYFTYADTEEVDVNFDTETKIITIKPIKSGEKQCL